MRRVKIYGITNHIDARMALQAGADVLGFVFSASPRQIDSRASLRHHGATAAIHNRCRRVRARPPVEGSADISILQAVGGTASGGRLERQLPVSTGTRHQGFSHRQYARRGRHQCLSGGGQSVGYACTGTARGSRKGIRLGSAAKQIFRPSSHRCRRVACRKRGATATAMHAVVR